MNNKNITFAVLLAVSATVPASAQPLPTIPSGTVPLPCLLMKINKQYGPLLDCYLNHPDNYFTARFIERQYGSQSLKWKEWPAIFKQDLSAAFSATMAWWESGMVSYPGTQAPDVPSNQREALVYHGTIPARTGTILSETDIARIYNARIAMLLATEIYSWVPWSIKSYLQPHTSNAFNPLFDDRMAGRVHKDASGTDVPSGRGPMYHVTPGNPLTVLKFLKTNNLIGATRADTVERILNWARWNLSHMFGDYGAPNHYRYWQYWGQPPVAKILSRTITTFPGLQSEAYNPQHWINGCFGTSSLLVELFQAVNIPVEQVRVGWHNSVYFIGERKYMTHGDDPYDNFAKSTRPVSAFLIDPVKYAAWFPGNDPNAGDANVARGVMEDNIDYPSDALVNLHRLDVQEGRTHADSRVFQYYARWYSVAALEQKGLWQRLDAKL